MNKYIITAEQIDVIQKLQPKLAHEIMQQSQYQSIDDSVALIGHLNENARQLVEAGIENFDLPVTGGRFVWEPDVRKQLSANNGKVVGTAWRSSAVGSIVFVAVQYEHYWVAYVDPVAAFHDEKASIQHCAEWGCKLSWQEAHAFFPSLVIEQYKYYSESRTVTLTKKE